jgi:putative transposase
LTCLSELISPDPQVSVRHQCELLDLCRSSYYYQCCPETEENLALMRRLDELHLEHPVYGSRKLTVLLRQEGLALNRKRVVRLLRLMGIEAIYAKPRTSLPEPGHQIYPYLLRDLEVTGPDQVWCSDITYVPMATGFLYLVAVMDWWSRYVLGWRLSNTMEAAFCVDAWEAALRVGRQAPLVSNTDQGSQFTSPLFIDAVESAGVDVSMDGRGRWLDNRFIERLWRSVKYEDIYLQDYGGGLDAGRGLGRWFEGYNKERPHQALDYATPAEVYFDPGAYGAQPAHWEAMQPQESRPRRRT